jgi:hypothetical protein
MNTKDEALKLALEALSLTADRMKIQRDAITAIKQAIAAPEEPEWKQIAEDLRFHGLTLVKTATGYAVLKLGAVQAQATLPAAPVQEPVAVVSGYYSGQCVVLPTDPARLFNSGTAFYTTPPGGRQSEDCLTAAPVPDALTDRDPETPEYREGWNDCRAFMLNWRNNQ